MELYGSFASPFVRRIRILLESTEFSFIETKVLDPIEREKLLPKNPIGKIPVLVDGDNIIWDSLLIEEYLNPEVKNLSIEIKKQLILINELTDAGLIVFQMNKGMISDDYLLQKSKDRMKEIFSYLNSNLIDNEIIKRWLFCTMDWFAFREIYQCNAKKLVQFYNEYQKRADFAHTDPRSV